MVEDDVDNF